MSNKAKELRSQLRQVAKELLPDMMNDLQYETLKKHVEAKVAEIEKFVKEKMTEMNERHRDTMSYLVRNVSTTKPSDKE